METEEKGNSINLSSSSIKLENESNLTTTITTATTDTESVPELHESQLNGADTELQQQPQPPQSQTETTVLDKSDAQDFVLGESQSVSLHPLVVEGGEGEEVAEATEEREEIEAPQEDVEKEVENRDLVAKEERNEDVNGNANAGNNEMETETGTEGVADVAAKLETLSQEVETVEAEVTEVKEKLEVAENMENMEKKDAVEEKKEDADVVDKVEMDNVVEEAETVKVKEEEEGAEKTGISGMGGEVEAMEQKEVTDFLEEGKAEKTEVADVAGEMEAVELIEMTEIVEEENVEKMEANEEEEKQPAQQVEMTDIAEETREDEKNEMTDIEEMKVAEKIETTDVAGGMEEAINEEGEMKETEKIDVAEEGDEEEDTKVEMAEKENEAEDMLDEMEGEMKETEMIDVAEEGDKEEDAKVEMAEKENEAEDMLDEMEGAEEEVEKVGTSGGGGKRKRQKNAKAPSRATSKKKTEEDVCFICFDGGELVLCDRRGCPKAYHPSCVNRDEAFFRAKGRWNCGWHLCSNCEKNAYYMCYTCTFSLCKGCIKDAVILCVRGNKGFCETCMKTVMLIERNEQGNKETGQVDFDDKSSWEFLFKDYWTDLKERLSLTPEELAQAKNPWKGSDSHAGKQELADELYDVHNGGSGSGPDSSENAEVTTSKRRKPKKRLRSRAKERDSPGSSSWAGGESADESVEWASKELLEFVMHVKNGDQSACSQFDVQALLLEYIKRNKLRDPRRKSQIICDSRLENLFGKPRVGHFEMLKLLESHYLLKDDSQADDLQGSVVDTEANQLEADGNSDALMKASKDKRRRSRKKGEGRGLQSNIDDYAAIDMHNINLIYLRRSLLEDLIEDTEAFYNKVVGSFVRIRISGSAQKQDLYRLVQIIGTSKAAEPYRVGKKMTNFMLEILNLNKTELVSIDIISNQEFTEDECKRLRQSIKCGLIHRLTVGDIQEKAMAIQAVRVQDLLEAEITRFSHLCDRASDMGHRKELRECVEKLQLLKTPEERQRRLEEIPEIHADPNMDPSHESDEDESETEDKRQENSLRRRGSGFSRRGREQISPRKGAFASNDTWGGSRSYSSMNREPSRNMTDKGFSNEGDDFGAGEAANENLWGQGREKPTQQSQSWEMPKTASNASQARNSTVTSESVPRVAPEISPATPSTVVAQSTAKVNEAEKIWHYKDPSGKNQGPFSMVQLRKWNNTGYFPADLRIWRNTETKDNSILLTDALSGNFQSDPPAVDNSFPKTQLVQSPHLPSSYTGNIAQAAPVPVEVPRYSTGRWGSGTNLPSPTPGQTATSLMKGQVFESQVTPTQSQPVGSVLGANQSSGDNVEQQHATVISGTPKVSHGVSPVPRLETGMLPSSSNAPQMHSQSMLTGESPKVLVNSHLHSALDTDRENKEALACKSISKRKLRTAVDIEDVRREVAIMSTLPEHPNIVKLKATYEDYENVHLVMELCEGGELFDRIVARGHYSERAAAHVARTVAEVVRMCHANGVMHRDLKPENFLFANKKENSALKAIDFGLSVFFKPGERFSEIVGSPYYMAPEVLKRNYGPEVDVWSAGVILYILLCGVPPFWAETEQGVALAILRGVIDFKREPWPQISESAKSLVRQMLEPDPRKRLNAQQVLEHPWLQNAKKAPNVPLGDIVRTRLKQFSVMNRFKKKALRVIAEHLTVEEVEVIRDMFALMDTDNDGKVTYEELRTGLRKVGSQLAEPEIKMLMEVADVDGNGVLDYGEFVAVTIHLQKMENDEHFRRAFMFFDTDGSGYIELDELRGALADEYGETDNDVLNDIMREVDTDKDGCISYEEFVAMMKAGTDWRKASRQYSRERFKSLSLNLMKDGSLHLHDAFTGQSVAV